MIPTGEGRAYQDGRVDAGPDGDEAFRFTCGCGAVTHVFIQVEAPPGSDPSTWRLPGGEFSVTCDGCGRSHWFTVKEFRGQEDGG